MGCGILLKPFKLKIHTHDPHSAPTNWSVTVFGLSLRRPPSKGDHPYVFHLIQASLWNKAVENNEVYYPPTYEVDGFTHGTSNPDKLLNVANHFYSEVGGLVLSQDDGRKSRFYRCKDGVLRALPRLVINNQISMAQMMNCFLTSMEVSIRMLSWRFIMLREVLMEPT